MFRGHKLLQKDEPIYAEDKSKSKHPAALVLHGAQYQEMYVKGGD
jgi:hypothetical protein